MDAVQTFSIAVANFRAWANNLEIAQTDRGGEWECDYEAWDEIYRTWAALLAFAPVRRWSTATTADGIYAIARDNESQFLAKAVTACGVDALLYLAQAALSRDEPDARWQLAVELGSVGVATGGSDACATPVVAMLLRLIDDENEYVRRRALQSLARVAPQLVEPLALREWDSAPDSMPWTRMNVLAVLSTAKSPQLAGLQRLAIAASNTYLREFAIQMQTAAVDQSAT
jgi:hypothetical protein